ncbi:hypothetical protein LCGC14_0471730 [marine sediment metagenome]|uniref:Uncharacterized protein n=1 Tax=marine sediment metagenome TaxID=412755 RepID=A0A0F9UZ02_9ZZZZ|nr:MAG: hypothetical protein Lokiarch_25280 [Candidatus Lokiarchaeum sp. GC14_75]HEC37615.1 hypothetical protein [bacterium]
MPEKKKEVRINFRTNERFKTRLKDFLQEKNMRLSDFCHQAISEKMKKMGGYNNNSVMKQIKELSKKLNGVNSKIKDQTITMEKQAKIGEKESKFDTYKEIEMKITLITNIIETHRKTNSYRVSKSNGNILGKTTGDIIEESKLNREEVWDILKQSGKFIKCKNGGWDLNV